MGKITGFLEYQRLHEAAEDKASRTQHYREFVQHLTADEAAVRIIGENLQRIAPIAGPLAALIGKTVSTQGQAPSAIPGVPQAAPDANPTPPAEDDDATA